MHYIYRHRGVELSGPKSNMTCGWWMDDDILYSLSGWTAFVIFCEPHDDPREIKSILDTNEFKWWTHFFLSKSGLTGDRGPRGGAWSVWIAAEEPWLAVEWSRSQYTMTSNKLEWCWPIDGWLAHRAEEHEECVKIQLILATTDKQRGKDRVDAQRLRSKSHAFVYRSTFPNDQNQDVLLTHRKLIHCQQNPNSIIQQTRMFSVQWTGPTIAQRVWELQQKSASQ